MNNNTIQKAMFAIKNQNSSLVKSISLPETHTGITVIWINKSQKHNFVISQSKSFQATKNIIITD
ncbi:hypothetical protein [Spiroplasma endosymbiont of Agriotes lineatus]|uniref:hypothetical protein n=1 Tax=Spiroplasma endosymbiont of Agriotes lineatus TaxID=3077930 RepID=UPI0030D4F57C